jgi:hypothetical protein
MKNYPKKRKHCGYTKCNICGKIFIARGIGTHRREAHKMVVKSFANNSNFSLITVVNDNITVVNDSSVSVVRSFIKEPSLFKPTSNHKISKTIDKDQMEDNYNKETHLYNETDLSILYGRLRMLLYSQHYPPHIMKERLIQDFEQRFDCKFYEVEHSNARASFNKIFAENSNLASEYAGLTYSR